MEKKLVYEVLICTDDIRTEDSGCAKIATLAEDSPEENGVFFRFQSWNELDQTHPLFDSLIIPGKRVRITLEVL